jgi:hypothetical protein
MTQIAKDFADFDPKTAISTNVYRCVAVPEVQDRQCLCEL